MRAKEFIIESISSYINQIPDLQWKPVSKFVWMAIQDEGLDEEQDAFEPENWSMATLQITPEDVKGLKSFNDDVVNKFNSFDIALKDKYPGLVDLIDYDRGVVIIVKNNLIVNEAPLPSNWDTGQYEPGTTFKQRLNYALERAKKIGTGSSRVAMIIEYEGRPTVLKIAKNKKGLAQNSVEADILSDGYASQLGILIPIIDYDTRNREPTWIHTELAQKASEQQLCKLIGCDNLSQLVNMADSLTGKKQWNVGKYQDYIKMFQNRGYSDDQIENIENIVNSLVDLSNSYDVELVDFTRKANWGIYKGEPVIIDVGFNSNVLQQYYKR